MPKSRNNRKNRKDKQFGLPRSKESRQKIRRWSFSGELPLENGGKTGFDLPGMSVGTAADAQATADRLLEQFKSSPEAPAGVKIIPIGHETVSPEIQRQLQGLNDQQNLFNKATFILAENYRLATGSEKDLLTIVTEATEEARKALFPKLEQAIEKVAAITQQIADQESAAAAAPAPKRKLGIEALNEILEAPPEE